MWHVIMIIFALIGFVCFAFFALCCAAVFTRHRRIARGLVED